MRRDGRIERLRTAWRLGPLNVGRVAAYRFGIRSGLRAWTMPGGKGWSQPVFETDHRPAPAELPAPPELPTSSREALIAEAGELLGGNIRLFSGPPVDVGAPPRWHVDPLEPSSAADPLAHWSRRNDSVRDIKTIWELSRFTWAPTLARAWRVTGDSRYAETLETWIRDWTTRNPVNLGPNWACGQETSLRMLHVLVAAHILGCIDHPAPGLVRFVREHLARISATTAYAIGQDNNHGTSEAAALFVGGSWLRTTADDPAGGLYATRGRQMLEERVARLVAIDGGFSQYSVVYHRVLLDTLSATEWWRRRIDAPAFSATYGERARAATRWLYEMTDPASGDAPNVGANDGAMLLGLSSAGYRDFRPSVQLAAALFCDARAYESPDADEIAAWLGVSVPDTPLPVRTSRVFADTGWVTLHAPASGSWACVRFPAFRFRPSHADALHIDLWSGGRNLLRDGGTFSYAAEEPRARYFAGTESHNTVMFDGVDQMPRLGRFLFGSWLETENAGDVEMAGDDARLVWSGSYRNDLGHHHGREVRVTADGWTIVDTLSGARDRMVAHWRLVPGDYAIDDRRCVGDSFEIEIDAGPEVALAFTEGVESRFYLQERQLPVLEVTFGPSATTVTTRIRLRESRV